MSLPDRHVTGQWKVAWVGELPLAALLLSVAARLLRMVQRARWTELGHDGDMPPLRRVTFMELLQGSQS